ncbi:MAG: phosphotransferase [Clostridium sp.]
MFDILREINVSPGINQRTLSRNCKKSLGKINAMMDELEREHYIVKELFGREHRYYVSKKGLDFLDEQLQIKKKTFLELHTDNNIKPTQAVILAAGKNSCFNESTALLEIENEKLIKRTINQLKSNGITKIIVVGGYNIDGLKNELNTNNDSDEFIVVENSKYKWSGTMKSLSVAEEYIDGDFILIESDIVIEDNGITKLVESFHRDCILITTETGSGDEAFVELNGNKIFKISKDIAQLNRIDGEMIGISKISYDFFIKMMENFKDNKNPYVNYEYIMLDVARNYSLGYEKIDGLLWHEIDNKSHYVYVTEKLMKRIHSKEESIKLENLKDIVVDVMKVGKNNINSISPIGGMTNKNYKVIIGSEAFVLRVPGNGTEEMISRIDEFDNAIYAAKVGVDAELVYFNKESGIKVSKFIENAETLSDEASKQEHNMRLVCDILRNLHNSKMPMKNTFDVYEKVSVYEELLKKTNNPNFDDYNEVKDRVICLKNVMRELDVELTPCHNDTLAANFIKSGDDKIYLIDWEYGGMNDPMWDIAAHCLENGFSDEDEELFLEVYFNGKPEPKYLKRVLINKIYQDFLWSLWTKVKEGNGDDFGTYGIDRYNRAKKNLDLILGNGGI